MKNKGQALILFVLLLPLVIMAFVYLFDSAYIILNNNKLNAVAEESIKYLVEDNKSIDEVKNFISLNDKEIEIEMITTSSIYLKKSITPLFGKYMGYDRYNLEVKLYGYMENNKLKTIEKG